jgi:hypothetical protein
MFFALFILMTLPLVFTLDYQSRFGTCYASKNYIPLIIESQPFAVTGVAAKIDCLYACLQEYDCSLVFFSKDDQQCKIYSLFSIVEQELLPDDNTIVYAFERTLILKLNQSTENKFVSYQVSSLSD